MQQKLHQKSSSFVDNAEYAIVVDVGSSATRAHIYLWDSNNPSQSAHRIAFKDKQPITSDLLNDKFETLDNILLDLLFHFAAEHIPKPCRHKTDLMMMATAGFRLMEKTAQVIILERMRMHAQKSPFRYSSTSQVGVIDGKDEGRFAWVSLNHKAVDWTTAVDTNQPAVGTSVGIIDLGGASTQIAYQVPPDVDDADGNPLTFGVIPGRGPYIYSLSRLGGGLREKFKKMEHYQHLIRTLSEAEYSKDNWVLLRNATRFHHFYNRQFVKKQKEPAMFVCAHADIGEAPLSSFEACDAMIRRFAKETNLLGPDPASPAINVEPKLNPNNPHNLKHCYKF
jgi:Golgi nucleoside diphosphatase